MGNYISNNSVYLATRRTLMRYGAKNPAIKGNDENAHRPAAAPFDHYKAMHENKEYLKMSEKLDQNLDWKLKGVYVKSKGENPDLKGKIRIRK